MEKLTFDSEVIGKPINELKMMKSCYIPCDFSLIKKQANARFRLSYEMSLFYHKFCMHKRSWSFMNDWNDESK
jgi:hypothetical protein